ncbi:MAG: 16S rRNA (guanine(966)-N(2))-methyltransferase RsmD [Acidimicrobiales bacterium]
MRVVAGTARGRRLEAPDGTATRPTGDRVREAVFNSLHSLGAIEGATVLDLFAGSGALGIEALSRGAAHATFVDADRRSIAAVEANLAATGLAAQATVVRSDADSVLSRAVVEGRRWDLALLDPPYAFDEWADLLTGFPADLVVVESDRSIEPPPGWGVVRERRYGSTLVAVLRPT